MAKKRNKGSAPQWVKVDGVGWVKATITRCPKGRARGVKRAKAPGVDMGHRSDLHQGYVNPTGLYLSPFGVR